MTSNHAYTYEIIRNSIIINPKFSLNTADFYCAGKTARDAACQSRVKI